MEIYDLTDKIDWSDHDLDYNFSLLDSSAIVDFHDGRNEVEGNGGNGIEINWDKYEVSYDCPVCVRKMLKDVRNSSGCGERMWADHMTPIFNDSSSTTLAQKLSDNEAPLEHIRTCAFYFFQPPVTTFDIEYLDAVERKHDFAALPVSSFPELKGGIKSEVKSSSDYGSEDSEYPLTPIHDLLSEDMLDLCSGEEDIDVESLDYEVTNHFLKNHNLYDNNNNNNNHNNNKNHTNHNHSSNNHNNNNTSNDNSLDQNSDTFSILFNESSSFHNDSSTFDNNNTTTTISNSSSCSSSRSSSSSSSSSHNNNNNINNNSSPSKHDNSILENHNYCTTSNYKKQQQQYRFHKQHYKQQQHHYHLQQQHHYDDDDDEDVEYYPPYYYNRLNNHNNKHTYSRNNNSNHPNNKQHKRSFRARSPSPSYHPSHPYRHHHKASSSSSSRPRKAYQEETSKRAQHNVLERQRRSNLKELFVCLKNHVPSLSAPHSACKFSKVSILDHACSHIKRLNREGDVLEQQLAELKKLHSLLQRSLRP